jgi:Mn2+/Fe2+ NRAMP family transporter
MSRCLKWLSLSLFAYVATVLIVHVPWARSWPGWSAASHAGRRYATMVVAMLGTTISPYLFFWQANVEVEEEMENPEPSR